MTSPPHEDPPTASILMVDDKPANLLALEAILEPLGHKLVKANSGEEALKRLLHDDFALILLDVQMPGMDGWEAASLIKARERTRHIPIIFLTAVSREAAHVFKGYASGAVDYLLKPFDPEILRAKVSVFVDLYLKGELLRRREAELRAHEREALERRNEVHFRAVTDALPLCMWLADARGEIRHGNRFWAEYVGAEGNVTTSDEVFSSVHADDRAKLETGWREAVQKVVSFEFQFRLRRARDGAFRWHLGRAVPERDESDQVTGWVVTATDIDDQKRAEEAKDQFLAAASHELRTPLTAAKAHAQVALRRLNGSTEEGSGRALTAIAKQIDRMSRLVTDLLDVSRLQAGRLTLEVGRFEMMGLLREVQERFAGFSNQHTIAIRAGDNVTIEADRERVDQVVTNLLSNAIRYSPRGGTVEVTLAQESDGSAHLTVRDHGVGIPAEKQGQIFERFGRAHGATYGGIGLGLTIAQGIVEQHGGRIWVESEGVAGQGSTFHVVLPPRAKERPARVPEGTAPANTARDESVTV